MKIRAFTVLFAISCSLFAQTTFNSTPARTFGQPSLSSGSLTSASPLLSGSPNLIEGREMYRPQALVFDTSSNPPVVYVVDTFNNRVLGWKNPASLAKGAYADVAVGQTNLSSTRKGGPGTSQSTGLYLPTSAAVDSQGRLYVVDSGNNRVLRFPKPFSLSDPDMVIGQTSFSSSGGVLANIANQGAAVPDATRLFLANSSGLFATAAVFDSAGNLWLTDPGNNRVLRYSASSLSKTTQGPAADLVIGQADFASATNVEPSNSVLVRLRKNSIYQPGGIAFDGDGNLYVSDSATPSGHGGRVLFYQAPVSTNGQNATRILGVQSPTKTETTIRAYEACPLTAPYPCGATLGSASGVPPQGLAVLSGRLYVADPGNHRVVQYDNYKNWPTECAFNGTAVCPDGQLISPSGTQFIGQPDGSSVKSNQSSQPSSGTLSSPSAIAFLNNELWVADSGNNRVSAWPQSGSYFLSATRLLGQVDFGYNAPNLVEGKELFMYDRAASHILNGNYYAGGLAVDSTTTTPHLYVADSFNNRILGFKDSRKVKPGQTADLVIGQLDLFSTSPNYLTHDTQSPTETTLNGPVGLLVDSVGDLWVADAGNCRVVRFPRPFEQSGVVTANLVLGQASFYGPLVCDARQDRMGAPWGLAMTNDGHLLVSDLAYNRVLMFKKPTGGDFSNGQAAWVAFGQPDFSSSATGSGLNQLSAPRGIATDSSDRLYVADSGNNRVSIFSSILAGSMGPDARFAPTVNRPLAVAADRNTGQIWVTDFNTSITPNRVLRFPIYQDWVSSITPSLPSGQALDAIYSTTTLDTTYASFPLAIALDANGNPIIAESNNQISLYYVLATFQHVYSYSSKGLTPGMLAYLYRYGPEFPGISPATATFVAGSQPLPTTLSDLQVYVNGTLSPIFNVSTSRVDFQVPWSAPTSGTARLQLVRASTQEILADASVKMQTAAPGLATANATGSGQLAALNQDGTVNTLLNPAARGSIISVFGTGIGPVPNAPADGSTSTALQPLNAQNVSVYITNPGPSGALDSSNVKYFGLVTWFPGVFQLNVQIPQSVPPTASGSPGSILYLFWQDFTSTDGIDPSTHVSGNVKTYIAVK